MSLSKEIGGYFELECNGRSSCFTENVLLNSARNALQYAIQAYGIRQIAVPYYTCPVIWQVIQAKNCKIIPYDVDENLLPGKSFEPDMFVLCNNYFGVCGRNIERLQQKYKNLIVDNAQAFYAPKRGVASFYSPRKFFGLPDGGILACDKRCEEEFEKAVSYDLCNHLLKRLDLGAEAGYSDFQKNDEALIGRPIQKISKLTEALMGNIDYEFARQKRLENFAILHEALSDKNELKLDLSSDDVPMVYPFLTRAADGLREKLIQNKVYVARYWPEIEEVCPNNSFELYLQSHLLPLPMDQRYDVNDMKRILEVLND